MKAELPTIRADSSAHRTRERFEAWRAGLGTSSDVSRRTDAQPFSFATAWWRYGKLMVGHAQAQSFRVDRTPRHARLDQMDHYVVLIRTQGAMRYESKDDRRLLMPGSIMVFDTARAYALDHDAGSYLAVYIPRDHLDDALPRPMELHGLKLQGAAATLLAAQLCSLPASLDNVGTTAAPMLADGTLGLLVASLTPSPDTIDHARPTMELNLLRQMCRYIDLHLEEPGLSPLQLAAFFKVSRTTLYLLFEPLDGVANYIRERRLSRVYELLMNSQGRQYISKVAHDHGFNNVEHFTRVFRTRFGQTPLSVLRDRGAAAVDSTTQVTRGEADPAVQFSRMLRALRD